MSRKVVGIVVAIALAAVGTVALVSYVQSAEKRAQAGEELVEVYVVGESIPAGTSADELEEYVTVELVPAKVQPINSVQSLQRLSGRVAAVDLVVGEQLVDSRFVEPADAATREVGVIVPSGKLEVTVELEQQRVIGGLLTPGDTVAVFASFEPFEVSAGVVEIDGEEVAIPDAVADGAGTPNTTQIILRKALVTAVQQSATTGGFSNDDEDEDRLREAPADNVFLTLAIDPADAERVVFTQEFGFVYVALERSDVPENPTEQITRGNVYDEPDSLTVSP
ncbi:MAG: Flp pilus assembly protein CpaB [Acidimicrobiia bacterium]